MPAAIHLHSRLQLCEAGDGTVERDNLTIRNERSDLLLMNCFDHLGIFPVQPNSISRKEIQIATAAKSEAALPIPFRLKCRENTSSVSVANMGATQFLAVRAFEAAPWRQLAVRRAGCDRTSNLTCQLQGKPKRRSVRVGPPKKPPANISSLHQKGSKRLKRRTRFLTFGLRSARTRSCQPNTIPPARLIARAS